jgi:hypothetical protein
MISQSSGNLTLATSLNSMTSSCDQLLSVKKSDLRPGDRVCVVTANSRYEICALGGGMYAVSGGWFDKNGKSPTTITISGCTWGGSAIKVDVVAACGLRLEFGNRLITSPIRKIMVLSHAIRN